VDNAARLAAEWDADPLPPKGVKLVVVLVQNHGSASIGALSQSLR
jgi:hypothetical protein